MAIQTKHIDDWKPQIDGLIGKFGGGGGGSGLGAIIGGAIAAGTTAAIVGSGSASGNKGGGGGIAALPKNPIDGNLPLVEGETAGTPTPEPTPEQPKKEEEKEPIIPPSEPSIKDETGTNIENQVNSLDMMAWLEEQQKKQWEREDTIRKETQEREDNAYQRAVKDMQKAGINPNLMNVSAAASGGGITQATGMNYEPYQIEMDKYVALLEQEIDNAFKEDENAKDRFADILGKFIQTFSFVLMMKRNTK